VILLLPSSLPWFVPLLFVPLLGCMAPVATREYVLGSPVEPRHSVAVLSERPTIWVYPVSVPDYLDTRDILVRDGRNEVKASASGRWAERFSAGVNRALIAGLAKRLPAVAVVAEKPVTSPTQQIAVDIQAFEIGPSQQCVLVAVWTLSSGDGVHVLRQERNTFVEPTIDNSDARIAAAMSKAIDRLAIQIIVSSGLATNAQIYLR
jgi:uncharacterized protein